MKSLAWLGDQFALSNGIAPLVHRQLEEWSCSSSVRLQNAYLYNSLRNRSLLLELSLVLTAFKDMSVPVMALKGAHLAEQVYGDVGLRPMADLDLLIPPERLTEAMQCLLDLGYTWDECGRKEDGVDYTRHHHLPPFQKPGAVPVEIHRSLSNSLTIAVERLWERARDAAVAGVPVQVLSPEDLILHLCVHAAHNHRFKVPLIHLCDIAWSVERYRDELDWHRAAAIAEEWGASRIVYSTLQLVDEILGLELKPGDFEAFRHEPADRDIVPMLRDFLLSPEPGLPAGWQEIGQQSGMSDKLRSLARSLFPPRGRMRQIYGLTAGSALPLYYLYRPLDLLIRRGSLLAGLALRSPRLRPRLERERQRRQVHRWLDSSVETSPF